MTNTITIRTYRAADAHTLADLFYDCVHGVAREAYTDEQVNAWAPLPRDYAGWQARFEECPPFVAELDGRIVGFAALEPNGYIDWLYTHRDYQHRGVATALYAYLEEIAKASGLRRLQVDASHLARHFFKRRGFLVLNRNEIERHGVPLINWSMDKLI